MKALVLSSGGVDSTTCIGIAIEKVGIKNVSTISIFYGQKHRKELEAAENIAKFYNLKHYNLDLSEVLKYSNCSLLQGSTEEIIHKSYAEQIAENGEGMVPTYVPFRNGLMLSAVSSIAMSLYPEEETFIYLGAHADDAAGRAYADCSPEFTNTMNKAINIGTYGKVKLIAPLINLNKVQVVAEGIKLGVPYQFTWSCYEGGEKPCGKCGTCIDRARAFKLNGIKDPALGDD